MFGWLKKLAGGGRETAPPPAFVPEGPLTEAELQLALERPCVPLVFEKPANIDPFATMFGAVRLAQKDEGWPTCQAAPMVPLCQINLSQAPLVPDALRDVSLLTLFIAPEHARAPTEIINTLDPDPAANWTLRSYGALDGLTIPKAPAHGSTLSPRLGEWGAVTPDYANHDMADAVVDIAANDVYAYDWSRSVSQTKLGGWPSTVQAVPWWADAAGADTWDFVLQIETEPKAGWHGWGDGAAYIARSRERPHLWAIDVQFT